ncbi:MAG: hypothetical protein IJ679_05615 [Lachnospiraceae bacterium]|nr:hypothetical protein [Lachnospiraceae bacterium]
MNNSAIFPFERNHYFYGKLLSVEDFEMEQRYMNNKRRLLNRSLFGAGVVTGLNVVDVDEQTVSVETGFALDSWGREIVLSEPLTTKLENIAGFKTCIREDADIIYLCLEYREQGKEEVHSIVDEQSIEKKHRDFGRTQEGYHLFLTTLEPEEELRNMLSSKSWIECPKVVWENEDIRITQTLPRLMQKGKDATLSIRIQNRGRSTVSFSYDIELSGLVSASDGKSVLRVNFDESLYEKTGDYELTFPIIATTGSAERASVSVKTDSVHLQLSDNECEISIQSEQSVELTEKNEAEAIKEHYYQMPMEQVFEEGDPAPIYLAKLFVVSAVDTYMIEKVENVPFHQYVSNNKLLDSLIDRLAKKEYVGPRFDAGAEGQSKVGAEAQTLGQVSIMQGVADLVIQGGKKGDVTFSPEITHGIGLGRVAIILGLEDSRSEIVYGDEDIFTEEEAKKIHVRLAAKVNEDDGSFVIGAKLTESTQGGRIRVYWTAICDRHNVYEKSEKRIFIKPNLLEMTVRTSYQLECVCENMAEKTVQWQVRDEGGFVDEKGLYTAPNTPGVYEVIACSVVDPEIKASIFVVVRE